MTAAIQPAGYPASSINRQLLDSALETFKQKHPHVLLAAHDTMFSSIAITIRQEQMDQMAEVIAAIERVVALPAWQRHVLGEDYDKYIPANPGVFFGYDFHLNEAGAHLIEVNTNAGGGFLGALFEHSQRDAGLPGKSLAADDIDRVFVDMFKREWELQRGLVPLHTIAIVDEAPQTQYFYPEFVLAKQVFERAGIEAVIADPGELKAGAEGLYLGDRQIGMVYNRLTDFALEKFPHLLDACQRNLLVLTPHPHAYKLYADKRNLRLLTDADFLRTTGLDESSIDVLQQGVPQTRLVEAKDAEHWWKERKDWFFKPATGYGGRGSYRGDKLTRRVFDDILQGGYVAQRKAQPGEVMVSAENTEPAAFKYDVRCYVYEGKIQLVIARLYQGQTTNFRTAGGGFGLVRIMD